MSELVDGLGVDQSTDYSLSACDIVTSDGSIISIAKMIRGLSIYEDIFCPYVTGDILIYDAMDIISNFALHGNEYIMIELTKPSLDVPIKKTFRIYKIADREFITQAMQQYRIYFCSEEMILSSQMYLRNAYSGMTIDAMIVDILTNKLKVSPQKLGGIFTKTSGNFDIVIPRMQPLEAAMWLTTRAYNTNETLFFLFENRDGYNFTSLEQLIKLPPYKTYSKAPKVQQEPSKNMNSFDHIIFNNDFDVIKASRYGQHSVSLMTFDLLNRNFSTTNYSADTMSKDSFLNSYLPVNTFKNRMNSSLLGSPDSLVKFYATTDSDPNKNPMLPENWLMQTALKMSQLHSTKVALTMPSDFLLKVGMVVELNIPKPVPQEKVFAVDEYKSGKYLISKVKHTIAKDLSTSTIQLLTDSYTTPLHAPADSMPALQDVIKQ